ncbi:MAG TPA: isochorismatase family protein [Clostridiaceae bacterium]|nr:isochorismatase family protein [Clostridiaceae bacterium]
MNLDQFKIKRDEAFLFTIDMQERLVPAMDQSTFCRSRAERMLQAAEIFGLPGCLTEQYPQGLGASVDEIAAAAEACGHPIFSKISFNACIDEVMAHLRASRRHSIIVTGIETHVCVFQTVRALLEMDYNVFVPEDAVSSRTAENRLNALNQFRDMGACVTNTETLLFDLLGVAGTTEFKAISKLVK